jgi:hypothetical protein
MLSRTTADSEFSEVGLTQRRKPWNKNLPIGCNLVSLALYGRTKAVPHYDIKCIDARGEERYRSDENR